MKPQALAIVVLALTAVGCAVSEKTPSSNPIDGVSAKRQPVAGTARNAAPASNKSVAPNADEDFDLLEEEFAKRVVEVADPLEPVNRIMCHINDALYFWVLKPVMQVYKTVAPAPARVGIRNFFNNVTTPVRLVNCLAQGKGAAAGKELHRFAINTTAGVLGFGDPACDKHGLEPAEEDLGQTLAVHGIGNGPYIVWPLLGPSTLRDSVGKVGDLFLNPLHYVEPAEAAVGISCLGATNEGSFHIGEYESFKAAAVEPYVAMRQAYIQYRTKQVQK